MNYNVICEIIFILYIIFYINTNDKEEKGDFMAKTKRQITPMGKEIKRRLVELEMSQEELATSVGCSPQYINHIIYGERSGEKYLEQIFLILGMDEYHD